MGEGWGHPGLMDEKGKLSGQIFVPICGNEKKIVADSKSHRAKAKGDCLFLGEFTGDKETWDRGDLSTGRSQVVHCSGFQAVLLLCMGIGIDSPAFFKCVGVNDPGRKPEVPECPT
jgi:hypothetical protein